MAYVKISEIYQDGRARGYGTAAFNVFDYEGIKWALEVGEEEGMPIIIAFYPGYIDYIPADVISGIAKHLARQVKIPVAVHLDHGRSYEIVVSNLKFFDSVMVDGSALPYEENVALSKAVIRVAHTMGVEVEAELGHVGMGMNANDISIDHFTTPEGAADFAAQTGCDSLAISIGNAHGKYLARPSLDFERAKAIRAATDVPLVLHGGSGIPAEQFTECARLGMSKFNVFTDVNMAFAAALRDAFEDGAEVMYPTLKGVRDRVKELMRSKVRMLNPHGVRVI